MEVVRMEMSFFSGVVARNIFRCTAPLLVIALWPLQASLAAEVPVGTKLHSTQTIVIGNGAEPASLDPNKIEGVPEFNLALELFEGLVSQDSSGKIIGGAAEKWESKDNATLWTFTLRKNAKWSDGTPVTAADFEYAYKRLADPRTASPYSWYLGVACKIVNATAILEGKKPPSELGVTALNEHTLQIRLESPLAFLIEVLNNAALAPIPRRQVEKFGDRWTEAGNLISNGPYKLSERIVNERIVLVRNPMYWNNSKTVIDKATYLPINNQTVEYQRYRTNAMDVTSNGGVPSEQVAQIRKEIPKELAIWPALGVYYYALNLRLKPFDDPKVRRALSLAINRDVIARQILSTGEQPAFNYSPGVAGSYVPPSHDWERLSQAQRDAEARKLLAEAGYGPGNTLKVPLLYNTNEQHKKVALVIASMWKRIGNIEVDLVNQEWKTYLDSINRGEFSVARRGWLATYNEPSVMLDVLHSKHGSNDGKYNNPKYDETVERAKRTMDPAERSKVYHEAERIIAQDIPVLPIYHYSNRRLIKPWVGGNGQNPLGRVLARDLYILAH
jgi:oligopeptide transport system substrate-binding protein